jgi:hypothetical protein
VISRRIMVYINLPEGPITLEWARDEADRLAGEWQDAVTDEQRERLWVELGDLMVVASLGKGKKPGQEGLPPGACRSAAASRGSPRWMRRSCLS